MPFEYIYADNEIRTFVHHIFDLYDRHVEAEEILKFLVDTNLEMSFPGMEIRSFQDFLKWYLEVERNYEWNTHQLEQIDIKIADHGRYKVDIVLQWEALTRGNREVVVYSLRQEWMLVEGRTGLKIARYIVKEFNQLPTPHSFQAGNLTDQLSFSRGRDLKKEHQVQADTSLGTRFNSFPRCTCQHPRRQCELNEAVARNDLFTAERLLKQGHDANSRDATGFTPLMVAAGRGYVQMTQLLLAAGADPTMVDTVMGATALHKAAQSGVVDVARLLVNHGAFLDAQAPTLGNTPLIDAVWHKRPAMVRYLLEQGARLEIMNRFGRTALSFAEPLDPNKPATVEVEIQSLLEKRQKLYEDMIKSQKLMAAVCRGDPSEVCKLLADNPLLDEKAPLTSIPVDAAPLIARPPQGSLPTARDIAGYTPLLVAALLGHTDIVRKLLKVRANPLLVDEMMRATPGHKAGYQGHAEAAQALVDDGRFEIDAQGPYNGYTALHDAIWHGHVEAARVFVEAGARLDLRTHTGHTPLELAIEYGYPEIEEMIRQKLTEGKKPSSEDQ